MIDSWLLDKLRCPIDRERQALLESRDDHLACVRCGVRFRIRDGIPNLVADEAELPAGCDNHSRLPCQVKAAVSQE